MGGSSVPCQVSGSQRAARSGRTDGRALTAAFPRSLLRTSLLCPLLMISRGVPDQTPRYEAPAEPLKHACLLTPFLETTAATNAFHEQFEAPCAMPPTPSPALAPQSPVSFRRDSNNFQEQTPWPAFDTRTMQSRSQHRPACPSPIRLTQRSSFISRQCCRPPKSLTPNALLTTALGRIQVTPTSLSASRKRGTLVQLLRSDLSI